MWAIRVIKEISQYLPFLNFFFSLSAENPKFFKVNLKLFESYFCELICFWGARACFSHVILITNIFHSHYIHSLAPPWHEPWTHSIAGENLNFHCGPGRAAWMTKMCACLTRHIRARSENSAGKCALGLGESIQLFRTSLRPISMEKSTFENSAVRFSDLR